MSLAPDADGNQEPGLDFKTIGYYFMISVPIAFTIFGLIYMCRRNCEIREKCCKCCVDLEKRDINLEYGTYYYADDGERRQDVMEVSFDVIFFLFIFWEAGRGSTSFLISFA